MTLKSTFSADSFVDCLVLVYHEARVLVHMHFAPNQMQPLSLSLSYLSPEPGITLEADMWLLVPVHGDDMSAGVARLLELHLADGADVVLLLQGEVGVGDHLRVVLLLLTPLLLGLLHGRPFLLLLLHRRDIPHEGR